MSRSLTYAELAEALKITPETRLEHLISANY
jgi:DNA-binding CsgD family transcriptional regulator